MQLDLEALVAKHLPNDEKLLSFERDAVSAETEDDDDEKVPITAARIKATIECSELLER